MAYKSFELEHIANRASYLYKMGKYFHFYSGFSFFYTKLADMRASRAVLSSSVLEIHGSVWEKLREGVIHKPRGQIFGYI